MEYFNLMEVIVNDTVDEVIKNNGNMKDLEYHKTDIMAYVLNRVPARYVTSERGIIHGRIDTRLRFQQHTDILFLIYEGIEIFSKRRKCGPENGSFDSVWKKGLIPHIMGEVLEEKTLSVIPGVKITLFLDGEPVRMIDENWRNPYYTAAATRGYFHFWPDIDDKIDDTTKSVTFTVRYDHDSCEDHEVQFTVNLNEKMKIGKSHTIPMALMKLKEGADESILVSDCNQ